MREAIAEFQRASTDLLDALRLHFNLSVAHNLAGMFGEEARPNAWVVRHQPRLAAGHLALATSLSRFESYEDALSHYRTAMSLRRSLLSPELEERIRNLTLQATKHQAGPGSELQGSARSLSEVMGKVVSGALSGQIPGQCPLVVEELQDRRWPDTAVTLW